MGLNHLSSSRAKIFKHDELRAQAELDLNNIRAKPILDMFGLGSAR